MRQILEDAVISYRQEVANLLMLVAPVLAGVALLTWQNLPTAPVEVELDPVDVIFTCLIPHDSATVYPTEAMIESATDSVQFTGLCWEADKIIRCSGACDTIPAWRFKNGVPERTET